MSRVLVVGGERLHCEGNFGGVGEGPGDLDCSAAGAGVVKQGDAAVTTTEEGQVPSLHGHRCGCLNERGLVVWAALAASWCHLGVGVGRLEATFAAGTCCPLNAPTQSEMLST